MSEGFLGRWSRRKQEALAQQPEPETAPERGNEKVRAPELPPEHAAAAQAEPGKSVANAPLPTLEDVRTLTPDSDFQPFMRSGVGAEVRNAAMKKLFTDPHFNVMDGLDIYIDDYNTPNPLPLAVIKAVAKANRFVINRMQLRDGRVHRVGRELDVSRGLRDLTIGRSELARAHSSGKTTRSSLWMSSSLGPLAPFLPASLAAGALWQWIGPGAAMASGAIAAAIAAWLMLSQPVKTPSA